MSVESRISSARQRLTPAERRVADIVLTQPQDVAFGTVAELARQAATSGATVVRLAAKLGLDGFSALQSEVQSELTTRLRPAAQRIRGPLPTDVVSKALAAELDNVQATLDAVSRDDFEVAVALLADTAHRVHVLPGEASFGVGRLLADQLAMLRPGVDIFGGTEVRVAQELAEVEPADAVIVIDLRRYERWVVHAVAQLKEKGARVVALSDSALSPLADLADLIFVVRGEGVGPFDSQVGTLVLANTLVAGVAARLRDSATDRLDRIEAAWRESGALLDS